MFSLPEPFHPMVVHFPIALFITALLFEIVSYISKKDVFHKTALVMYVFAALMVPLVVQTGHWEEHRLKIHHPILHQHEEFAERLMWFVLISLPLLLAAKKKFMKYFRIIFLVALIGSVVLVSLTADKGGQMVYNEMVGVEE